MCSIPQTHGRCGPAFGFEHSHKVQKTPASQPEASQVPGTRFSPLSSPPLSSSSDSSGSEVTTLMLRNIPRKYTDRAVTRELQLRVGLASIDFIYLPWDSARNLNNGHVFVNCVTPLAACALAERLDKQPWECGPGKKRVEVRAATAQGIAANLARYVESLHARPGGPNPSTEPRQHGEPRFPLVFQNGKVIPFLRAVETCCPPHVRASVARRGWDVGPSPAAGPRVRSGCNGSSYNRMLRAESLLSTQAAGPLGAVVGEQAALQSRVAPPNTSGVASSGLQPLGEAQFSGEGWQSGTRFFSSTCASQWQHMMQPLDELFYDVAVGESLPATHVPNTSLLTKPDHGF